MRGLLFAPVLLAGCDGAPPAPLAEPVLQPDPERVEAGKACAAITGYRQGRADALLAEEYKACVAAVTDDKSPELRGRSDAPT